MSDNILFGNKVSFAIEITPTKKPATFKLGFWVNKVKIGLFTKAGKLSESIKAYNKFVKHKDSYYLPLFDKMPSEDIPFYILGLSKTTFRSNTSSKEIEIRSKLAFSLIEFGEQFYNSNNSIFILYKASRVLFLICGKGILDAKLHEVSFENFVNAFEQYITYCDENEIVLKKKHLNIEMLEFFSLYQYANYRQFKLIHGTSPSDEVDRKTAFVIQCDENEFERNVEKGIFYCLMHYSNIKDAPQQMIHFLFIDKMLANEHVILFARDYQCDLYFGINRKDGKIVLIEPNESKYMYVSKSEHSFFEFLKLYLEYSVLDLSVGSDDNLIELYRNKCIEAAGGKEYQEYYTYVFPSKQLNGPWKIDFPYSF